MSLNYTISSGSLFFGDGDEWEVMHGVLYCAGLKPIHIYVRQRVGRIRDFD